MPLLGVNAKLNYKVGGQAGGGAWVEVTIVKDVALNITRDEADTTVRGNGGWKSSDASLKSASLEFTIVPEPENAQYEVLQTAFLNGDMIGFQCLDKTAGDGLQGDFKIHEFSRNEPIGEAISISVVAKPTSSATAPSWIDGA